MKDIYQTFLNLNLLSQIIIVVFVIYIISWYFRRTILGVFENWILKRFINRNTQDGPIILFNEKGSYSYLVDRIVNKKTAEEIESDYTRIGYKKETIETLEAMVRQLSQK